MLCPVKIPTGISLESPIVIARILFSLIEVYNGFYVDLG